MIRKFAIALVLPLIAAAFAQAADPAATSDLPAGLQAIGVKADQVVSAKAAHAVRGQTGTTTTTTSPVTILEQYKSFTLSGATLASGSSVNLLEGVIGQIKSTTTTTSSGSTTTTSLEALFGGLAGNIGMSGGTLNFSLAGKSLQETLNLQGGSFTQDFSQFYKLFK